MKKVFSIIASLLISCLFAFAQNVNVIGTVKDAKGEPVPGAAIILKDNASVGCVSDIDGKWTLSVPADAVLSVSCIGFKSMEVPVSKRTVIPIVIEDDAELLDEVVVVGYGSMRRSDLTGSVASIKVDEDEAARSLSLDQMMQGRAAGVQIVSNSGSPDGGVVFRIRGNSTFNGDGQPLFVVDGVMIDSSQSSDTLLSKDDTGDMEEQSNGLLGLNPQDIASVEILKDASATAIYGAMGANGVVLITTKQANRDKPVIRFNAGVDVSNRSKKADIMGFDEFCDYVAIVNPSRLSQIFEDPEARTGLKVTPMDWQDYCMRTAVSRRYYFSISGRPKSLSYQFSLGYSNKQGIIKNSGLKQITSRLNVDKTFSKNFKMGVKLNLAYIDSDMIQGTSTASMSANSSLIRSMLSFRPYSSDTDILDDDYDPAESSSLSGPDKWLNDFKNNRVQYKVTPNIYLQVKILPFMSFKSSFGADYRNTERTKFKSVQLNRALATGSLGAISTDNAFTYNFDNTFLFDHKFNSGHSLSGTAGMSMRYSSSDSHITEGWNIEEYKAMADAIATAPHTRFTYTESASSTLSFFARAVYNYKDRYVLTSTFRADGSSKFTGNNKFSFFPSFAFAWRLNEEPWFNVPVISQAKVRLGWGQVGNQNISNYRTLTNYTSSVVATHYPDIENSRVVGIVPSNLANTDLKWETTEQTNAGIDFAMFKGRLALTVDAYYKYTKDLLQQMNVPVSSGYSKVWVNQGSILNRGIEFTLTATPVKTKNFEWMIDGNIAFNRNKVVSIGNTQSPEKIYLSKYDAEPTEVVKFYGNNVGSGSVANYAANIFIEGYPAGLFYGIASDGIVGKDEEGCSFSGKVGEGYISYYDLNNDGKIDTSDRTIIGDPNPDFTYGFGTSFSFFGVNIGLRFNGSYGNDILNINAMKEDNLSSTYVNHSTRSFRNAYPATTDYPAVKCWQSSDMIFISDRFVEDGSYLRLSSMSVGYDFPIDKKKSRVVKGLGISVAANNLFVITNYSGWDPEVNSYGTNMLKMGLDSGSYPHSRTFSFDLKFTF